MKKINNKIIKKNYLYQKKNIKHINILKMEGKLVNIFFKFF